jgi:hypothetical protein
MGCGHLQTESRDMNTLFENAVWAMQLGVRDYQANNPCRAVFAVQNLYSGILLLAQEVLVRKAPKATPEQLFGVRYKPVPDGRGGVKHVSASNRTVDLADIGQRFRDFGLAIDYGALRELNRIRADIECHSADDDLRESLREAIAKAVPIVAVLFRLAHEDMRASLGEAWQIMLEVQAAYERDLQQRREALRGSLISQLGLAGSKRRTAHPVRDFL